MSVRFRPVSGNSIYIEPRILHDLVGLWYQADFSHILLVHPSDLDVYHEAVSRVVDWNDVSILVMPQLQLS